MFKKWIEALGKYEKHIGSFVPFRDSEAGCYLTKSNCACALGVYLIEIKGIPAKEIAETGYETMEFWNLLNNELGADLASDIYHINDASGPNMSGYRSDDFGFVIERLKNYV